MLSVVDLIEAGTLDVDLAAYALAAIGGGASFMVGARPGGAGKTTVMGALLNFVPPAVELLAADGMTAIRGRPASPATPRCWVCHEIGRGPYYAYLWGAELRAYFELAGAGHMLATNLHADDYAEARQQICGDNDVPETHLQRMNLMLFLSVRRSGLQVRRRIASVWESDGSGPHRPLLGDGAPPDGLHASALVGPEAMGRARRVIDRLLADGARTIEQVRAAVLESA